MRAIFVADVHLQAQAPIARSAEPDWFAAMARPLEELHELKARCNDAPILYAGDIFNQWNASPEVINFALEYLPHGFAIPGQHDLPNHNYDEIKRSAYWTLVEAGQLDNLESGEVEGSSGLVLHGFPWGFPLTTSKHQERKYAVGALQIAVVHQFVWCTNTGYPGALKENLVGNLCKNITGYDAVVFGDNHKGFDALVNKMTICNCGALMRRKTDERDYRPSVSLLHADGTVTRHYLDISQDKFIEVTEAEEAVEKILDMTAFVSGLQDLEANDALDFVAAVKRFLKDNKVVGRVAEIILEATGCG